MLQYRDFKFDSKEDFINYIEKKMEKYWESHNDSFSQVCEDLDSYDGLFLGNSRYLSMDEFDDYLYDKKPSEVIQMIDTDNFDYSEDFFYYDDVYGIRSTNEKDYFNFVDYADVFEKLADNYGKLFNYRYGNDYLILFNDVDNINSQDEDEIQNSLDEGDYDYLFEDDKNFFSDDDLDY